MTELLAVGAGGFIGSCLRFVITKRASAMSASFPFGTLLSNAVAGLLIGFIVGLECRSVVIPPRTKLFLSAGFLGGLSTFSTFSLDTVHLFMAGRYLSALVNVLVNLGLGLSGVAAGMFMAKLA
ncbi:MAG: fluoride efflux transporter CrcB [Synergistaceae bacterium]|jgi:CrcB protein|nr:fluoride efflux transporter CrcB [Synergistaceae bacterium]